MRTVRARTLAVLAAAFLVVAGWFPHVAPLQSAAAPPDRPAATVRSVLPWIEDDYDRAVAVARERQIPMFVESWAPW